MKISKITQLFVSDIHDRHTKAVESGSRFVRLSVDQLGALLELLCELEMAAGQVNRPKIGEGTRYVSTQPIPRGVTVVHGEDSDG